MDDLGVYNLFVYGSLRSGFKSPAYEYISRFFSFVGDAKVKGKLFDLGAYPAGVPVSGENFITGELPIRTGLTTVGQAGADVGMPAQAPTIATALKALGVYAAAVQSRCITIHLPEPT